MDGVHDLGGVEGFGAIGHRVNTVTYKPYFEESWEHLPYCLAFIAFGPANLFRLDEARYASERIEPVQSMGMSYWDRILTSGISLYIERGIVTKDELEEVAGGTVPVAMKRAAPGRQARPAGNGYQVGDKIRVRDEHVPGHVRAPGYTRGKRGTIVHRTTKKFPFPDSAGHAMPAEAEPTYHVRFERCELWGEGAGKGAVYVDLWQSYLESDFSAS